MPGLEADRVAEILVTLGADEPGRRGSGYRVTAKTVLTAAHVVRGASKVRVRFDADQPGEWSADVTDVLGIAGIDAALLTITPPDHSQVVPVQFGRIGECDAVIKCSAVGFPLWKLRDHPRGPYRDSAHIVGSAAVLANRREGTLEITVAPPERDPDPDVSPWQGMSGASVFCHGRIIGIISKHHRSDGLGRLAASRVDGWEQRVSAEQLQGLKARLGMSQWLGQLADVIVPAAGKQVTSREIGAVTADLFDVEWAQLASEVQGYVAEPADPLIGRDWLAAEIDVFCRSHERGYFVIEGDAGMGKTAFAAWLARRKQCAAHFAQRSQDASTTVVAVRNLGAQLIASWDLDDLAPRGVLPQEADRTPAEWLRKVIAAAARRRDRAAPGRPIILVVDALDAAASPPENHLPLGLPHPGQLPGSVYVVATTRTGGLRYVPEGCVPRSLDKARKRNLADLRQYLTWSASKDDIADAITTAGISAEQFTNQLIDRSAGVWIYVQYVLEQIREDPQAIRELPGLPHGLTDWYHNNLARLCDGPDGIMLHMPLLATLAVAEEPLDAPALAALAGIGDRRRVEQVLDHALRPYCQVTSLPGNANRRFEVRHPSLSEYLTGSLGNSANGEGETDADPRIESVDSLQKRLASACHEARQRICNRYLTAWGELDRHLPDLGANPALGGMDGGYGLRWLTWHLLAAGREDELHHLLACGQHGRSIWFETHDYAGDMAGYLRDISRARAVAHRLGLQLRYALIEASIASLSTSLPPALLGELVKRGLWRASRAFSYIERITDEQQQALALANVASCLHGGELGELAGRGLSVAMRCRESENRAAALTAVIPLLPIDLLERALGDVLDLMRSAPCLSLEPMVAVISRLPRELLDSVHQRQAWIWALNRSRCVRAVKALFWSEDRADGTRYALAELAETREIFQEAHRDQQGQFVAALLPHLPPETFDDIVAAVGAAPDLDAALIALARHAPAERLCDLLDIATSKERASLGFIRAVAPRLTAGEIPAALRICQAIRSDRDRALAFAELAPHLDEEQARALLAPRVAPQVPQRARRDEPDPPRRSHPAFPETRRATSDGKLHGDFSYGFSVTDFLSLRDREYEYYAIGALLDQLPEEVSRAAVTELIIPRISKQTTAYWTSADLFQFANKRAFAAVGPYLSADQRRSTLAEIFTAMSFTRSDAEGEVPFLGRFAPFSEDEVASAFAVLASADPYSWWPQSAQMMADVLALHVRNNVLRRIPAHVMAIPVEEQCFTALAALGQLQHYTRRDDTAARALAMAAKIKRPSHRALAVAKLAPILLREDIATEAFDTVRSIGLLAGLWAMDAMADNLPPTLLRAAAQKAAAGRSITKPAKDIPRILGRLAGMGETGVIDSVLPHPNDHESVTRLAPLLSASQARRIWSSADMDSLHDAQAESLAALVSCLPEPERPAAVDTILAAYTSFDSDEVQARILGRLARAASTERLTRVLRQFLGRERTVKEWVLEEFAPGLPETLVEEALQYALSDDDDISCRALAKLAPRLSDALLDHAIAHVSDMEYERWKAVALTALAQQMPEDHQGRESVLVMALESAAIAPHWEGVMADLIPLLPERLRTRAVDAAVNSMCSELRGHHQPSGEKFDSLNAVLRVLRGSELEHLYTRLGNELQVPRVLAAAEAAVIRQAGVRHAVSFFADGPPLHHDWPTDSDRAGLMNLIAASAWWVRQHGEDSDVDEIIQAIFDVTGRWG